MRQFTYLALLSGITLARSTLISKRETPLNEFLAYLLQNAPALNDTINDAVQVITDLTATLADLVGETTTENQLGSGPCAEYTLIFARGTSEPGNMGALVGPPLVWALQDDVGTDGLTIQGVNEYAASVEGYLEGGDPSGSANM